MDFGDPFGHRPQKGEATSGTDVYHRAKLHADRWHRRRDIFPLTRKTESKLSDKTHTSVCRIEMKSAVEERWRSYNSEYDFVFDDGSDRTQQRDDEEQTADHYQQDSSDAQQVARVRCVRRHISYYRNSIVNQHPDANTDNCQPT